MSTENRNWISTGRTVAVISTGRHTGLKQITMDTIETIDGGNIVTTKGHKFDHATLEGPGDLAKMYDWRIANPETSEVRRDIAVQNREKALSVVRKYQDAMDADPTNWEAIGLLIQSLNRYRDTVIEADAAARRMQVSS